MITVIICTKDRPTKIIPCVQSILRNSFSQLEIIVVDQSAGTQTKRLLATLHDKRIIYLAQKMPGKSKGVNLAILKSKGDILAFTDDDCVVSLHWLSSIKKEFSEHPDISALFGKTLPYKPREHAGLHCPCTFTKTKKIIISKPLLHHRHIGYGNNMSIRASIFLELGGFKQWLGPGSIGISAEDAEIALRMLIHKKYILYNPTTIVYHDKWLTIEEQKRLHILYACGEMAAYGYMYFLHHPFARRVLHDNMIDSYNSSKRLIKSILSLRWHDIHPQKIIDVVLLIVFRLRGFLVGWYYGHTASAR